MSTVKCNNCHLVVNELLSFVQNKIDVMNNVSLALICRQSFDEEEIFKVKCLLFEAIPQRLVKRKGDDRKHKNIEDIIGVLKGTEPDDIPIFVARDLHKLPPVCFDHIDATRLLKDILVIQNQVRALQEKQDDFITKSDLDLECCKRKNVEDERQSSSKNRKCDPYFNTKRGGFCRRDSFYNNSGPEGLMTGLENVTSPPMSQQNRIIDPVSPSYWSVTAGAAEERVAAVTASPVSFTPAHRPSDARVEAHCGVKDTASLNLGNQALAQPPADTVTLRNAMAGVSNSDVVT